MANERARLLWGCLVWFALLVLLLLAIAGVILGAIAVDWLSGRIKCDSDCALDNDCYNGFKVQGKCFGRFPKDDGSNCNASSCQVPFESGYGECTFREYDPLGNFVEQSVCLGERSVGECIITPDCPDLTFAAFNTAPSDKDCDSEACYYTLDLSGGENADIDTPCTVDSPVWQQVCYAKLDTNDSFVEDNCLVAQPLCFDNNTISGCEYFFRDARPTQILLVRNARDDEEEGLFENAPVKDDDSNLQRLQELYNGQEGDNAQA